MRLVNEGVYVEYRNSGKAVSHESDFEVGLFILTASQGICNSRLLDLLSNRDTLLSVHSQGLFAEHIKASSRKPDREFSMHPVLDANDNCHCDPWLPFLD